MLNLFYCCLFVLANCGIAPPEKPPTPERAAHERQVACNALAKLPYIISASDLQTALDAYNNAYNKKEKELSRQSYMDLLIATCKYEEQVMRIVYPLKLCSRTMHNTLAIRVHPPTTRSVQIAQNLQILYEAQQILTPVKSIICIQPLGPSELPSYKYTAAYAKYNHTSSDEAVATLILPIHLFLLNCARGQNDPNYQENYAVFIKHLTDKLRQREITTNDLEWLRVLSSNKCEFVGTLTNLLTKIRKQRLNPEVSRYLQQHFEIDVPGDIDAIYMLARIGYRPLGLLVEAEPARSTPRARSRRASRRNADLQNQNRERGAAQINFTKQVCKCVYMRVAGNKPEANDAFYRHCARLNSKRLLAEVRDSYIAGCCARTTEQVATLTPAQKIHHQLWQRNQQAQAVTKTSNASPSSTAAGGSERYEPSASSNVSDASGLDSLAIRLSDASSLDLEIRLANLSGRVPWIYLHPIEEGNE